MPMLIVIRGGTPEPIPTGGRLDPGAQPLADVHRIRQRRVGQHQHEFRAAAADDDIGGAEVVPPQLSEGDENLVACGVPVRVVHPLEVIHVDLRQRQRRKGQTQGRDRSAARRSRWRRWSRPVSGSCSAWAAKWAARCRSCWASSRAAMAMCLERGSSVRVTKSSDWVRRCDARAERSSQLACLACRVRRRCGVHIVRGVGQPHALRETTAVVSIRREMRHAASCS